jgi:hypothetical protein
MRTPVEISHSTQQAAGYITGSRFQERQSVYLHRFFKTSFGTIQPALVETGSSFLGVDVGQTTKLVT